MPEPATPAGPDRHRRMQKQVWFITCTSLLFIAASIYVLLRLDLPEYAFLPAPVGLFLSFAIGYWWRLPRLPRGRRRLHHRGFTYYWLTLLVIPSAILLILVADATIGILYAYWPAMVGIGLFLGLGACWLWTELLVCLRPPALLRRALVYSTIAYYTVLPTTTAAFSVYAMFARDQRWEWRDLGILLLVVYSVVSLMVPLLIGLMTLTALGQSWRRHARRQLREMHAAEGLPMAAIAPRSPLLAHLDRTPWTLIVVAMECSAAFALLLPFVLIEDADHTHLYIYLPHWIGVLAIVAVWGGLLDAFTQRPRGLALGALGVLLFGLIFSVANAVLLRLAPLLEPPWFLLVVLQLGLIGLLAFAPLALLVGLVIHTTISRRPPAPLAPPSPSSP